MAGERLYRDKFFWLALFLGGFFLLQTLWFNLGMDQSIGVYSAWVWSEYGLAPYLGVWDLSFPGMFMVHRLALEIFGKSILGFRLFDFLVQLSSLGMIFYLSKRLSGSSWPGFLAGVFYGIYYYGLGAVGTGEREGFIFWLLLLSLLVMMGVQKRVWLRLILVGLLLGFAFQLKPFYGLSWLVFGGWILKEGLKERRQGIFLELAFFVLFCLVPSGLTVLYYWKLGALKELYQATLWYNFKAYSRVGPGGAESLWWSKLIALVSSISYENPLLVFSALIAILLPGKKKLEMGDKELFWVLLFLILMSLICYGLQSKFFPYQLIPLMGFLIIFAGEGFSWLGSWLKSGLSFLRARIFSLIFYLGVMLLMLIGHKPDLISFSANHSFRNLERAYLAGLNQSWDLHFSSNNYLVAKQLSGLIKPEDELGFFGPYPLIPFLLKKKLPSRFCCAQHFLFIPKDRELSLLQKQWAEEYLEAMFRTRPRFFLVSDFFPGQTHRFFYLRARSLKQALRERFPQLEKFLEENYVLKSQEGKVEVYEIKEKGLKAQEQTQ